MFSSLNQKAPKRVVITGSAGNIAYALATRVAAGEMLGKDQPVIIHLLDIPQMEGKLTGVEMELRDCAHPTLMDVVSTSDYAVAFTKADQCMFVGAKPRGPGMERSDLLKENGKIFIETGQAVDENANLDCKGVMVGNPANTNCLILNSQLKRLNPMNFSAMTRLDHNRSVAQLSMKVGMPMSSVSNACIWGNHSSTMQPDLTSCTIGGKKAYDVTSEEWRNGEFLETVQKRGAAIIKARGASSATSAANAALEHIRDLHHGTQGQWTSMGVQSDGNPYGVPSGLMFSFPVTCTPGSYKIVGGLQLSD